MVLTCEEMIGLCGVFCLCTAFAGIFLWLGIVGSMTDGSRISIFAAAGLMLTFSGFAAFVFIRQWRLRRTAAVENYSQI